jgi:hypothetical protein
MLEATLGLAQHHRNLTLFPILAEEGRDLPFLLMAEALSRGVLTIREVGQGQVPMLETQNKGPDPILILDGEQLIGAKQNRMTNRSILLPGESVTQIPVSCMEQGRWHFSAPGFTSAPQHSPSKVRRRARETEARSARRARAAAAMGDSAASSYRDLAAAQSDIWGEVRHFSAKLGSDSSTGALDSVYDRRRKELKKWLAAFPAFPHQTGLLAFLGATPLGLDALGSPALYRPLHERLLTGYVLDAIEGPNGGATEVDRLAAEGFITAVRTARRTPSESVGVGEYRILEGSALGGELAHDDRLVHLSAFPPETVAHDADGEPVVEQVRPPDPIAPPSRRRRLH